VCCAFFTIKIGTSGGLPCTTERTPGFHDWRYITGRSHTFSASLKWLSRQSQAASLHVLSARRIHALCSTCLHWSVPPLHYLTSSFREAGKPRSLLWRRRRTGSVSLQDQQVRKSRYSVRSVVSWQYERHFCLVISNPLDVWQRVKTQKRCFMFVYTCWIRHWLPFVNKCYCSFPVSTSVKIWPANQRVAKCG
jgi:hypothetical protein